MARNGGKSRSGNRGGKKGRKNHKRPRKKSFSQFDINEIESIKIIIKNCKKFSELNNLSPHFADEGGLTYRIAHQFSDYSKDKDNDKSINSTQLRKFYEEVKFLERKGSWEEAEVGFNLLRPKFAIAAAKKSDGKKLIPLEFYQIIKIAMDKIKVLRNNEKSYENLKLFARFFEAIVSYHKYFNKEYEDEKTARKEFKKEAKYNKDSKFETPNRLTELKFINLDHEDELTEIIEITDKISNFDSLVELEELDDPCFEDEDGFADRVAYHFSSLGSKSINSNQLRRFYNELKVIERKNNWKEAKLDFYLLKPRMAVSVARTSGDGGLIPWEFYYLIKSFMDKVKVDNDEESFENLKLLVRFLESVLGFHKFYSLD